MGWIIAYLISAVVVPAVYIAFDVSLSREKFTLTSGDEVLVKGLLCFAWPIWICIDAYSKISKSVVKSRKEKIENISGKILDNRNDRSFMVEIPECELKYIARAYRNKRTNLSAGQFEMIREELMHRLTEKTLLK